MDSDRRSHATRLYDIAVANGLSLSVDSDRLKILGHHKCPPELLEEIREYKIEIISLLTDVRQMRDMVFGKPSTDNNWDGCRDHWMAKDQIKWLIDQMRKLKVKPEVRQ